MEMDEEVLRQLRAKGSRQFRKFIKNFSPGDCLTGPNWNSGDHIYLGYTHDEWLLVINRGTWATDQVHMVRAGYFRTSDRPPKKHSNYVCPKTSEELEQILLRYCGRLKGYKKKRNFVFYLSEALSGGLGFRI